MNVGAHVTEKEKTKGWVVFSLSKMATMEVSGKGLDFENRNREVLLCLRSSYQF
jgi:hypothetical protein